jgi:hypothetical protein
VDGGVLVTAEKLPTVDLDCSPLAFSGRAKITDAIDAKQLVFPEL